MLGGPPKRPVVRVGDAIPVLDARADPDQAARRWRHCRARRTWCTEREPAPGRGEVFPKPLNKGVEVESDVVVARQAAGRERVADGRRAPSVSSVIGVCFTSCTPNVRAAPKAARLHVAGADARLLTV
jgi:hypothetical protein